MPSCSSILITLKVCASKVALCSNHIEFTFGVVDKADPSLIKPSTTLVTTFVSTVPSGNITLHF